MDFLDVGPLEILLIIVVALLLFGPEKMVDIARGLGRMLHQLRQASNQLTGELTREIDGLKESPKRILDDLEKETKDVQTALSLAAKDAADSPQPKASGNEPAATPTDQRK